MALSPLATLRGDCMHARCSHAPVVLGAFPTSHRVAPAHAGMKAGLAGRDTLRVFPPGLPGSGKINVRTYLNSLGKLICFTMCMTMKISFCW